MDNLEIQVKEALDKWWDDFWIVSRTTFNNWWCIVSEMMNIVDGIDAKPENTKEEFDKANALEELVNSALENVKPHLPETKEEYIDAMNEILKD